MDNKQEKLLAFPCEFPIKIVGLANDAFETSALEIINKHVKNLPENAIQQRQSKGEKYLSLTINITAESQEQLDAIYQNLTDSDDIIMAL